MGGSGGALAELWEALAELREALGELWEGLYIYIYTQKRRYFSEKRPAGGRIAPETRTFTKRRIFSEKRSAGGRIASETRT